MIFSQAQPKIVTLSSEVKWKWNCPCEKFPFCILVQKKNIHYKMMLGYSKPKTTVLTNYAHIHLYDCNCDRTYFFSFSMSCLKCLIFPLRIAFWPWHLQGKLIQPCPIQKCYNLNFYEFKWPIIQACQITNCQFHFRLFLKQLKPCVCHHYTLLTLKYEVKILPRNTYIFV